ncbi:MAG: PHP domain-containing protein [Eubacteriales bacterium]|nr:PHP domain-containing protein [Clostridiales bacterium]
MKRSLIFETPVYDLRELSRYNLHVHTCFSRCARADMQLPAILAEADRAGLEMIAITDHYHYHDYDEVCLAQCRMLKRLAEKTPHRVRVLFGSELSNYDVGKQLETPETNRALDYRLYACNHFQQSSFVHPENRTVRGYAEHILAGTKLLMLSGKADSIAHPLTGIRVPVCTQPEVGAAMTDAEIGEICELSAKTRTALEMNRCAITQDTDLCRRLWNLGREAGAYFHFGSDAHSIEFVDPSGYIDELAKLLN